MNCSREVIYSDLRVCLINFSFFLILVLNTQHQVFMTNTCSDGEKQNNWWHFGLTTWLTDLHVTTITLHLLILLPFHSLSLVPCEWQEAEAAEWDGAGRSRAFRGTSGRGSSNHIAFPPHFFKPKLGTNSDDDIKFTPRIAEWLCY